MTASRVHVPLSMIEGPAKVYFAMRFGEFYTIAELTEMTGLGRSTVNRYVDKLAEEQVVEVFCGDNPRGRPLNYYRIAEKEVASS